MQRFWESVGELFIIRTADNEGTLWHTQIKEEKQIFSFQCRSLFGHWAFLHRLCPSLS